MGNSKPPALPKPPKELGDLAKFLEARGYSLAFPFDDIRRPGYIGGFNDRGQEIIVDDGKCLAGVPKNKPAKVQLGNYQRKSTFSFKSFLTTFGDIFKLDVDYLKAKSVVITFPNSFLQTEYVTELDVDEHMAKVSPACSKRLTDPANFVILQVLQTDAMEYTFELKKKASQEVKARVEKKIGNIGIGDAKISLSWESDTKFSVVVSGVSLTIGYKAAKTGLAPLKPAELASLKKTIAAGGAKPA